MDYRFVVGDLLVQDVDAIVNAWNRNVIPWWLLLLQGVSGAIKRRAGVQPFRELTRVGPMPLGTAAVTGAGRLPYAALALIEDTLRTIDSSVRALVVRYPESQKGGARR